MRKTLLYNIVGITSAILASCTDDVVDSNPFLNGKEKTPITISALLDANDASASTRAENKDFKTGDELIAYLRHVTWDGNTGARTSVSADKAPLLVSFTKGSTDMTAYSGSDITPIGTGVALGMTTDNTKETTDLTASPVLYWDDFSNSVDADHDLRTSGHYLQSYYGYCYNGGTPTTALVNETGVLGWTVSSEQNVVPTGTDASNFQKSDLLWSAEQTPVPYAHVDAEGKKNHGTLVLPYTHAMSKITIEIVLDEGFDVYADGENKDKATAFVGKETTPTLYANRVTATTAPTYSHSTAVASGDDAKIQMRLADDEVTAKKSRVYEAIIAPTVMKYGNLLAQVTVDGNKYDINLTDAVLTTVPDGASAAWSSELKAYSIASSTLTKNIPVADYSTENGGITLPGVNYRIKVTLKKQKIEVKAYITDWKDVTASIEGAIMFDTDVVNSSVASGTEVTSTSFDLWRSTTNTAATDYDADSENDGIQKASTYTYSSGKWVGDPVLYWQNGSTSYYFRALAKVEDPSNNPNVITSVSGDQSASQGLDLLWAQTSKHTGKDANGNTIQENGADKVYEAGSAINPRTGDVPLTFEHAMSKISVILKNPDGVDDDAKVDLTGAKITVINLYDGGTINIKTGDIETLTSPADITPTPEDPRTIKDQPVDANFKLLNQIVIPQSLTQDKDGDTRDAAPTFYQSGELTLIYNDGTSLPTGGGSGTYYLTSELTPVPVDLYNETEVNTHNANLTGARSAGYEEKYTAEEAIAYNAALDGAVKEGDAKPSPGNYTADEATAYNAQLPGAVKEGDLDGNGDTYTAVQAAEYNANLPGAVKEGDPKPSSGNYTADEAAAFNASLPGAVTTDTTKKTYTAEDANAYNATLPGAVHEGDIQVPEHYVLPNGETPANTNLVSHTPGELKSAGTKIMLYVTLADGTRYSIELSKCKDMNSDNYVEKWKRGEHYTYEITLGKEEIIFRALVKDWVEKTGSGEATLDWD